MCFGTSLPGAYSNTPPIDEALARLAARQHGVATRAQLLAAGLTDRAIASRVDRRVLHRLYRAVYAVGHRGLSQEGRWMAAVLAAAARSALSHFSAGKLHAVSRFRADLIDIVTTGQRRVGPGVTVHRARTLDPRDITHVKGIPVTTIPRLLIDFSDVLPPHDLANVIHEAAFKRLLNLPAIEAAMRRANGRRNLHVLEEALALNASGSAGTKSKNESAFVALIKGADLTTPRINTHVAELEADNYWPEHALIVEVDGSGHERDRTREEDAEKDAAWRAAGLTVVRYTDRELKKRPRAVLADLVARMDG